MSRVHVFLQCDSVRALRESFHILLTYEWPCWMNFSIVTMLWIVNSRTVRRGDTWSGCAGGLGARGRACERARGAARGQLVARVGGAAPCGGSAAARPSGGRPLVRSRLCAPFALHCKYHHHHHNPGQHPPSPLYSPSGSHIYLRLQRRNLLQMSYINCVRKPDSWKQESRLCQKLQIWAKLSETPDLIMEIRFGYVRKSLVFESLSAFYFVKHLFIKINTSESRIVTRSKHEFAF